MNRASTLAFSPGAAGPLLADEPDLSWEDAAECQFVDADLWFPEKGGSTRDAKRICMGCSVRTACLEYALENRIPFGVWGGKSEPERRRILRDRARAALAA